MWNDLAQDDLRRAMGLVEELCERYQAALTEDDLEALADLLLRLCEPDDEYPCGEETARGECPRGMVLDSLDDTTSARARQAQRLPAPPPDSAPGVVQVLVARLLVAANLTGRRRYVARLRLWGYESKEVAALLRLPLATVNTEWRYAQEALRSALATGCTDQMPARGVAKSAVREVDAREVLRLEQLRVTYVPPSHCERGQERCRKNGVCSYCGPRLWR